MNNLTKQWFDEANKNNDIEKDLEENKSKVSFKKSPQNGSSAAAVAKLTVNNKTYHKLNSKNAASILIDSSEDDDDEDDQVIIDKTKLIKWNYIYVMNNIWIFFIFI